MSTTDTLADSKPLPTGPKKPAGTEYIVLLEDTPTDSDYRVWVEERGTVNPVFAGSAADAVRKAGGNEGVYVAVPARSFQPVKVKVETTTHLKLEDA